MTEAYEIGISLALRDGVSESIGVARRDMAAIEAAIAASGVPLQKLHEAATGLRRANTIKPAAVSREKAARVATATGAAGGDAPTGGLQTAAAPGGDVGSHPVTAAPAALPDSGSSVRAPETASRAAVLAGAAVVPTVRPTAPDQGTSEAARPEPFRGPEAWRPEQPRPEHLGFERAEKQTGVHPTAEPRRAQEAASGPVAAVRTSGAPPGQVWVQLTPKKDWGAPATLEALPPAISREPANAQRTATYLPRESGVIASSPQAGTAPAQRARGETFEAGSSETRSRRPEHTPMQASPSAEPDDGAVAPIGLVRHGASKMTAGGDAANTAEPREEPGAQGNDHRPTEGDVYLDGALVGRWLARHMAKEAGRPGVGPTGFDARRSPLRPGATIGD